MTWSTGLPIKRLLVLRLPALLLALAASEGKTLTTLAETNRCHSSGQVTGYSCVAALGREGAFTSHRRRHGIWPFQPRG